MDNSKEESTSFTPRQYQVELLEKAIKKNVVVCLGTGSGKTFIAVMLIREMMESIRKAYKEGGKRTFFLAKTVPLVAQQATVIRQHTGLKVGHYTGSMNVDSWDIDVWKREFEKNEVFVMTTQILVNILNMAFIQISEINLLIFDECHHAVGGDPIVQVMKNFARCAVSEQPKVMGLTASVLNGKCKQNQILGKIRKLEVTLNSVIETPSNTVMAAQFSTKPEELFVCCSDLTFYDTVKNGLVLALRAELDKLPKAPTDKDLERFAEEPEDGDDSDDDENFDDDFDDDDEFKYIIGPVIKLGRLLKDLTFAVKELGLWCTSIIAKQMITELGKIEDDITTEENAMHFQNVKDFIERLVEKMDVYFKKCTENEYERMKKFSSHKMGRLLETLLKYKPKNVEPNLDLLSQKQLLKDVTLNDPAAMKEFDETCPKSDDFKAIIFVERRSSAWVINKFLHQLKEYTNDYDFITSEFVIGHGADPAKLHYAQMKSRKQAEKILKFRLQECNVLVATRVVEEGMDIPTCNLVIRFDEPKDFRAYVQSKGRARARDSSYIMFVKEDDYEELSGNIALYRNIEDALQEICKDRLPPTETEIENFYDMEIPPYYPKGLNGPVITMFSAIQLVNRYCALLPKDKFTRLNPKLKFQKFRPRCPPPCGDVDADDPDLWDDFDVLVSNVVQGEKYEFRCILWLPVNSSLRKGITGDIMRTVKLAKKSVAMKACQLLHECGELNDDLLPACKDYSQFTKQLVSVEEEEVPFGTALPGSVKRRQIYSKRVALQFKTCPRPNTSCHLYLIRIKLSKLPKEKIGGTLYDTEKTSHNFGIITSSKLPKIVPFPIFTQNGKHWVEIIELNTDLDFEAAQLEEIALFHHKFFTDLLGIKSFPMDFKPLQAEMGLLVIPIINHGDTNAPFYHPDWELIQKINNIKFGYLPTNEERQQFCFDETVFTDSIVAPLYTEEKIYFIVKNVMHGIHPTHPFPNGGYKTFLDYYQRKYHIEIQNKRQPLLAVKMVSDSGLNMLPIKVEKTRKKKSMKIGDQVMDQDTFFVPELCFVLPMMASHFNQGMMIPSIIYRLNDLLLTHEFLKDVSVDTRFLNLSEFVNGKWSDVEKQCRDLAVENENNWEFDYKKEFDLEISITEADPEPHVILNALTTRAANDSFDLERLEFLGDSFLKYATTLYLFSEFPTADEGKLTCGRGKLVSNSHLYQLAKNDGLANLIKIEVFSPSSRWMPPGFVTKASSESKLLEAGIPFHAWKYFVGYDLSQMNEGQIWSLAIKNCGKNADDTADLNREEDVRNLAKFQLISDKSVADSVEAILGAYLLYSGPEAALRFLVYLGFKILPVDESSGMTEVMPYQFPTTALVNLRKPVPKKLLAGLDVFENDIGYVFKEKSFLVQAFTHPSYNNNLVTDCYQRLEFLGDAILDYLVTWHLFKDKRKFTPGELTDMRSALVNNITFATLAVKYYFNYHLNARSPALFTAISKFLAIMERENTNTSLLFEEEECLDEEQVEVPKALGDIFESVAGAIYLDSGCSLDAVWNVYFEIMESTINEYMINTPKAPVREVFEMFPDIKFGKARPEAKNDEDDPQKYSVTVRLAAKTFKGIGSSARQAKVNVAKLILRFVKRNPKKLTALGGVDPSNAEGKPLTLDDIFEMDEMEVE